MTMRLFRLRVSWRSCVAIALAITGLVVLPASGSTTTSCERSATGWLRLTAPAFFNQPVAPATPADGPVGLSNSIVAWTVLPGSGRVVLASDGAEIVRSADGGCTWSTVFTVTGAMVGSDSDPWAPSATLPYYVDSIVTAPRASTAQRVFAVLTPGVAAGGAGAGLGSEPPALVAVSVDAGVSWKLTSPSLPINADIPHCSTIEWAGTSADGSQLTVVCAPGTVDEEMNTATWDSNFYLMFSTRDMGATWTKLHLPPGWWAGPQTLSVDAGVAKGYWGIGTVAQGNGTRPWLYHSSDGMTWTRASTPFPFKAVIDGSFGVIDRMDAPSARHQLLVWASGEGVFQSSDVGKHWRQDVAPPSTDALIRGKAPTVAGAAYLPNGDIMVVEQQTAPGCNEGHASFLRLRQPRWTSSAVPAPPASWGGDIAGISGTQASGAGVGSAYALVATKGDCGPGFLASFTGSR